MKYILMILLVVPFTCAYSSESSVPDYQEIHKPYISMTCLDSKTQSEMDACSQKSLNLRTKQLDTILTRLMKNYRANDPGRVKILEKSQHSWQGYKKASCALETYESRQGSGYVSILNACLETKINERINYIQWLLDNP